MKPIQSDKDEYFIKAVREGYRARSAYKLLQLARCFDLFEDVKRVVDLCAAPGSWSQVISNKLHGLSNFIVEESVDLRSDVTIVAVDLDAMQNVPGVIQLKADITKQSTCVEIMRLFNGEKVDLVVCDGAHDVSGMELIDFQLHLGLITACIHIFLQTLKEGGSFVAKIFDTWGCRIFIKQLRLFFSEVHAVKPHSSRYESNECFAVCMGFKMPEGFDPSALTPFLDFSNRDFSGLTGIHKLYIPFLVTGMHTTGPAKMNKPNGNNEADVKKGSIDFIVKRDKAEEEYQEKAAKLSKLFKLCTKGSAKTTCAKAAKLKPGMFAKPFIVRLGKNDMVDFFRDFEELNREMRKVRRWKKFVKKMQKNGKTLYSKGDYKEDPIEEKALLEKLEKLTMNGPDNPWVIQKGKDHKTRRPDCFACRKIPRRNKNDASNVIRANHTFKPLSEDELAELFTSEETTYQDFTLKSQLDDLHDEKWSFFREIKPEKNLGDSSKYLILEDPNSAAVELVKERKEAFDELCQLADKINNETAE